MLLERGADPVEEDSEPWARPRAWAKKRGHSAVLAVLMFTGPLEERRFVDVSENAMYWYFVVLSWLPIYALIYFAPRLA